MNRIIVLIAASVACFAAPALAKPVCTILADAENGRIILREGPECDVPTSPASTFKLPLAAMGFDSRILTNADEPVWPYKPDYRANRPEASKATEPRAWLSESVLWYSQVLTRALGPARFKAYVDRFNYGDRDITGDPGRNNGLTHAWLSSSLKISPNGQIDFLRKLRNRQLGISAEAYEKTDAVTPSFPVSGDWRLQGKTGTGFARTARGAYDRDRPFGWFIGWAIRDGRSVLFARLDKETGRTPGPAGPRARDAFLQEFPALLARAGYR